MDIVVFIMILIHQINPKGYPDNIFQSDNSEKELLSLYLMLFYFQFYYLSELQIPNSIMITMR